MFKQKSPTFIIVFFVLFLIIFFILSSFTSPNNTEKENIIKGWDFESDSLNGWAVLSGNFPYLICHSDRLKFDKLGKQFLSTGETPYNYADSSFIGEIKSSEFIINFNYISFLIGGGADIQNLFLALVNSEDNKILFKSTGHNHDNMVKIIWNVSHLLGQKCYLKIVDKSVSSFGFLNIDEIKFLTSEGLKREQDFKEKQLRDWVNETTNLNSQKLDKRLPYKDKNLEKVSMPIGGIGAGQVSILGNGEFGSWELFNRINRFNFNKDSFFMIRTEIDDKSFNELSKSLKKDKKKNVNQSEKYTKVVFKRLFQSQQKTPDTIQSVEFFNDYPIGRWHFIDNALPVDISMEAFTPFIPTELNNSNFPSAVFKFKIKNKINFPVSLSLAGTIQNMVGHLGLSQIINGKSADYIAQQNKLFKDTKSTRILMTTADGRQSDKLKNEVSVISMDVNIANLIFPIRNAKFIEMEIHDWLNIIGEKFKNEVIWIRDAEVILRLNLEQRIKLIDAIKNGTALILSGQTATFNKLINVIDMPIIYDKAEEVNALTTPKIESDISANNDIKSLFEASEISQTQLNKSVSFKNYKLRENSKVLLSAQNNEPLIIMGNFGKGKVIVCGFDFIWDNNGLNSRLIVGSLLAMLGGGEFIRGNGLSKDAPGYGSMQFSVLDSEASSITQLPAIPILMMDFIRDGILNYVSSDSPSSQWSSYNSAICSSIKLDKSEEKEICFILTWHFPNHYWRFRWQDDWRLGNAYYNRFSDANSVTDHIINNWDYLNNETYKFSDALYNTTLPNFYIEAIGSTLAILNSPIFISTEKNNYYHWEGQGYIDGSCTLNCNHVMQYAQAPPFLFPEIGRNYRSTDYDVQMMDNGGIRYRLTMPLSEPRGSGPIIDGQIGIIIQTYREHLLSKDYNYLKDNWGKIRKAVYWLFEQDEDADGIIIKPQFHTFDWTLEGVNPIIGFGYLTALKCSMEMASIMNDNEIMDEVAKRYKSGQEKLLKECWDEKRKYFVQKLPEGQKIDYQLELGCHAVQLQGVFWERLLGLEDSAPNDKISKSLYSIYKNNWLSDFTSFMPDEITRVFASGEEKGLFNCTWRENERPVKAFPYDKEVWTGIEYIVASMMVQNENINDALKIVRAARERYNGVWRNPFADEESGIYYSRAMSSYSLLLSAQGFIFNFPENHIGFSPKIKSNNFKSFFCASEGWGSFAQKRQKNIQTNEISILHGILKIKTFTFAVPDFFKNVIINKIVIIRNSKSEPYSKYKTNNDALKFKPVLSKNEKVINILLDDLIVLKADEKIIIEFGNTQ